MSLYRMAIRNGCLIREKRNLLRFWIWKFNRSEEDHLIRMKNRMTMIRQEQAILTVGIPEEQERVKKAKDALLERNGIGYPSRDSYRRRREPQRLKKDVKLKLKLKVTNQKKGPKPLMHITPAH